MDKVKEVLNHFGYDESQLDLSTVYTGIRKEELSEILKKLPYAKLSEEKRVRVTIEYDPNYEKFLVIVTDT